MKNMVNIEEKLKKAEPTSLSEVEKSEILYSINSEIKNSEKSPSVSYLSINTYRNMKKKVLTKIVAVVLIFTSSVATAFASNSAKPGDRLFALDRAIESLQLAITINDAKSAELKLRFAEERLQEVRELVEELRIKSQLKTATSATTTAQSTATSTSSSTNTLEIEADVFTDVTIVKVELTNGVKELFETSLKTRDEIVDEITSKFSLIRADVDSALVFEIENRTSRANDRKISGKKSNSDNLAFASAITLEFLSGIKSDFVLSNNASSSLMVDEMLERFQNSLSNLPEDTSIKIDLDQNKNRIKFEVRPESSGDGKIRFKVEENKIEIKDSSGKLKIEIKSDGRIKIDSNKRSSDDKVDTEKSSDDSSDDDKSDSTRDDDMDDTDDEDHSNNSGTSTTGINIKSELKVEAEAKDGRTKVEVKLGGNDDKFILDTTIRADVVADVANRYGISTSSVDSIIKFDLDL